MFDRKDYFSIIKIALFNFGVEAMVYALMVIVVWDIYHYVLMRDEGPEKNDDVLVTKIECGRETEVKDIELEEEKGREEAFNGCNKLSIVLIERVTRTYRAASNQSRCKDYVVLDGQRYYGACNKSVIRCTYVVEGRKVEIFKLKYDKYRVDDENDV